MPHLLVVDVESTCWEDEPVKQSVDTMEIIEFGCVVCTSEGEIVKSFSQLAKPVERPELTPFCLQLTGITQDMVDQAPLYEEAVQRVNDQLAGFEWQCWVSWGKYDCNHLLAMQKRRGAAPDFLSAPHINLREAYQHYKGSSRRASAHAALKHFELEWEGSQHRGEDDALNYARIVQKMLPTVDALCSEAASGSS